MGRELILAVDAISKERGIARETLLENLETALLSAARRKYGGEGNLAVRIDRKSGDIGVFSVRTVVEEGQELEEGDIPLGEAREIDPELEPGDTIENSLEVDLKEFGRIAAQTAKQVLFQKVKEAERDAIYEEFKDKGGTIVSGTVTRRERGNVFVNIGKAEGILPIRQTLPNENLRRGDMVKAYIEEVRVSPRGPEIRLSRNHANFVAELFRLEVPEIYEGIVEIRAIVREPGDRTKMAVVSKDSMVDPVGACVGMKGTRVQSIVRELRGEKIDIIPWTDDPRLLIAKALSPATVERIGINEDDKSAMAVVAESQLSLAIGKKGQNVRLAMKLTGWDLDIMSDTEYDKIRHDQIEESLRRETGAAQAGADEPEPDSDAAVPDESPSGSEEPSEDEGGETLQEARIDEEQ